MGTLFFLWLKTGGRIDTRWDWYALCLLLALEVPAYLNVWRLWRMNRR